LWHTGDYEGLLALCDDKIEWIPPAYALEPGPKLGKDALREGIASYFEAFDEFWPEPEKFMDGAEPGSYLVFARTHTRGRGSGAAVTMEVAHLFLVRGGRFVRFQVIPDRAEALQIAGVEAASDAST
jgi:ketosteroid isomerase-like protein